jgi:hypothetical protein
MRSELRLTTMTQKKELDRDADLAISLLKSLAEEKPFCIQHSAFSIESYRIYQIRFPGKFQLVNIDS